MDFGSPTLLYGYYLIAKKDFRRVKHGQKPFNRAQVKNGREGSGDLLPKAHA